MRAKAYAPGRVELLGNHTDYNEGVMLGAAIDRGLNITGENREEDLITINSVSMGRAEVPCAELRAQTKQPWVNYVLGVIHELKALGIPIAGFSADLDGNLPAGSGLSSSAALEVATALLLLTLHQRELPPLEIAKACQGPNGSLLAFNPVCSTKSLPSMVEQTTLSFLMLALKRCERFRFRAALR